MFRCDGCGVSTKPGEKMVKVVVKKRRRIYQHEGRTPTEGWEVEKEARLDQACAARLTTGK